MDPTTDRLSEFKKKQTNLSNANISLTNLTQNTWIKFSTVQDHPILKPANWFANQIPWMVSICVTLALYVFKHNSSK